MTLENRLDANQKKAERAARSILKWLDLAETNTAAVLATSSFGATISSSDTYDAVEIYGIEAQSDKGLRAALKEWSRCALRAIGDPVSGGPVGVMHQEVA